MFKRLLLTNLFYICYYLLEKYVTYKQTNKPCWEGYIQYLTLYGLQQILHRL